VKVTDLHNMRQRWENGTMSMDKWNRAIDEYLTRDKKMAKQVTAPPLEWDTTYSFPINERLITEDFIKRFADAIGDPNPLYRDPTYARTTIWGTMIAPPTFNHAIACPGYFPLKPEIPGVVAFYGGTDHMYFKVIRPGDKFRVVNKYLGAMEKTRPGKPYRLFDVSNQRTYTNQREEIVAIATAHEMITATPPGKQNATTGNYPGGRVRHRYTREEKINRTIHDRSASDSCMTKRSCNMNVNEYHDTEEEI
jgi:acyl dehydratase